QFQFLTRCQHFIATQRESLEIRVSDEPGAGVSFNQFGNGVMTVAKEFWEYFLRNGKDVSACFVWKSIIENADLLRTGCVTLNNKRSGCPTQIILGLFARANEFDADSALSNVRFEN